MNQVYDGHQQRQTAGIRDVDAFQMPDRLLLDHGARVLDPVTSVRMQSNGQRLRPTAYIGDNLLVPHSLWTSLPFRSALDAAADHHQLRVMPDDDQQQRRSSLVGETDMQYAVRVRLEPKDQPIEVDSWRVLVTLRNQG